MTDPRSEVREFLSSRRARLTPDQAGLPAYGGNRRVAGLRREEVAMLAGVSVDYYVRLERGNLAGASDSVLDALAQHAPARRRGARSTCSTSPARRTGLKRQRRSRRHPSAPRCSRCSTRSRTRRRGCATAGTTSSPPNLLARALYSPVFDDPRRPVNTTRFAYLNPAAREFWRDYDQITHDAAAMLRLEAGRNPHDPELITLVGELSTQSELFRQRWASRDVKFHRSGTKRLHHPVVGDLELNFESMELPSEPGLVLNVYTAPRARRRPTPCKLLASWAATNEAEFAAERARRAGGA